MQGTWLQPNIRRLMITPTKSLPGLIPCRETSHLAPFIPLQGDENEKNNAQLGCGVSAVFHLNGERNDKIRQSRYQLCKMPDDPLYFLILHIFLPPNLRYPEYGVGTEKDLLKSVCDALTRCCTYLDATQTRMVERLARMLRRMMKDASAFGEQVVELGENGTMPLHSWETLPSRRWRREL